MNQINEQKQLIREYEPWEYLGTDLYDDFTLEDYIEYIKTVLIEEEGWEGIEAKDMNTEYCEKCWYRKYYLYKTRLETDEELRLRVQKEQKELKAKLKKEERERKAYERLKKKYENI